MKPPGEMACLTILQHRRASRQQGFPISCYRLTVHSALSGATPVM